MSEISVKSLDSNDKKSVFEVEVVEGNSKTSHQVELNHDEFQKLADGKVSPEELIISSFEFLLEREPKESILRSFNVSVISRYFPEFPREIKNYF